MRRSYYRQEATARRPTHSHSGNSRSSSVIITSLMILTGLGALGIAVGWL